MAQGMAPACTQACLQGATVLVFAYLCVGEVMPCLPGVAKAGGRLLALWAVQQLLLIAGLSCLAVLLASKSGRWPGARGHDGSQAAAKLLLKSLNVVPVMVAVPMTYCFSLSAPISQKSSP